MTPPTKESKQPGSWKEEVKRILRGYENECRWDSLGEVVNEGAKFLSFEDALQAIVEANKKWLIGEDGANFVTHTKKSRVQSLDDKHISITQYGISFGKTKPPYLRAVISYDKERKMIRFHEAKSDEYGISYKVGRNPASGVFHFRSRPFQGILPTGYYEKVGEHTYRLAQISTQNTQEAE